jgi:hypothetical protein
MYPITARATPTLDAVKPSTDTEVIAASAEAARSTTEAHICRVFLLMPMIRLLFIFEMEVILMYSTVFYDTVQGLRLDIDDRIILI